MSGFDWTPHKGGRWKAERSGDRVEGRVTAIENRDYGDKTRVVVTLRCADGIDREVGLTSNLVAQLSEMEPQVGDALQITLKNIKPLGGGQTYKEFTVKHKRASELDGGSTRAEQPRPVQTETIGPDPQKWGPADEEPF